MSALVEQELRLVFELIAQLRRQSRFEEAVVYAEQALERARTSLGEDHPATATGLVSLANLYGDMGKYKVAELLLQQAVAIFRQLGGETHPILATNLSNLAFIHQKLGNYAAAEPLYRQALAIDRKALGEEHPTVAIVLDNLAALYQEVGDYRAAEPLCRQALAIARQALGEQHPTVATVMSNLATLYHATGDYQAAEPLFRQALAIRRQALGEEHPAVAHTMDELARLYHTTGNYAAAEPLFRQALAIARQALGEQHPDVAYNLSNLALLYRATGKYAAAEPLYRQALAIRRQALGEEHPAVSASLNNLAVLYRAAGNYAAAEPLFRQALAIARKVLGEQHPDVATVMNELALLYLVTGDHRAAEPLFPQALAIRRQALGEEHPDVADNLNNLALLYRATGNYAAAEPLFRQALAIARKVLGEEHPAVATFTSNLALLYRATGDYRTAEPLHRQALAIRRQALGEEHPDVADNLNNLATLYFATGDYRAAEPLSQQALAIARKVLGEEHPAVADNLSNLATLYFATGNYRAAEPLHQQALAIRRQALGEGHFDVAVSLDNLASLCAAMQHADEARSLMAQAAAVIDRMIWQVFSISSERHRMAYLTSISGIFDASLSFLLQYRSQLPTAEQEAFDLVLRRKAIGAEALAAQRDAVLGGRYPALEPTLREVAALRGQIARKTLEGPGPEGVDLYRRHLAEWNAHRERLEAELVRQIPEVNLEQRLHAADRRAVAKALPASSVLVEFVRCEVRDFRAVRARGEPCWQPACYVAFVLPAGRLDEVKMVPLGEAEPIDQALAAFRDAIGSGGRHIRPQRKGRPEEEVGRGSELRSLVFDPLLPHLDGCTRLFLAPDGELTRLPFEVLPTADGWRLIDHYFISYLGSGRDLLRFGEALGGDPGEPMVIADPNFDLRAAAELSAPAETPAPPERRSRDLDRSGDMHFKPLQGAQEEGKWIAALLGVEPLLASDALEVTVKTRRSPRILHFATHGLFLPDQPRDRNAGSLSPAVSPATTGDRLQHLTHLESPLLRSFLALAGVNTWLRGGRLPEAAEDGMLNAEDVSGLDLLGTELCVLSACETALGSVHVGEGVFGLQRAFVLAGAKTLVMSQWQVPDTETRELMEEFYRHILAGKGRAEALRCAQLALKAKHPDAPVCWGGFICLGDPGPLPDWSSARGAITGLTT